MNDHGPLLPNRPRYEHIIRNENKLDRIRNYVVSNPWFGTRILRTGVPIAVAHEKAGNAGAVWAR